MGGGGVLLVLAEGGRGEDENRGWVLESKGGAGQGEWGWVGGHGREGAWGSKGWVGVSREGV